MRERYGFENRTIRQMYDEGAFRFWGGYAIYDRRCGGPDPIAYIQDARIAQKIVDALNAGAANGSLLDKDESSD